MDAVIGLVPQAEVGDGQERGIAGKPATPKTRQQVIVAILPGYVGEATRCHLIAYGDPRTRIKRGPDIDPCPYIRGKIPLFAPFCRHLKDIVFVLVAEVKKGLDPQR